MKTMYLITLFLFSFTTTSAQFTKGNKLLGGSASFGYNNMKSDLLNEPQQRSISFGLSPTYGWFTSSTTALGIKLNGAYSYSKSGSLNPFVSYGGTFGSSFFVQKYKNLDSRLSLYLELGINGSYAISKSTYGYYGEPNYVTRPQSWSTGLYATPGITYRLTQKLLLDVSLNSLFNTSYSHTKTSVEGASPYNSSGFSIGSTFNSSTPGGVGIGFK